MGGSLRFCPNYTLVKFSIIRRGGSRSRRKSTRFLLTDVSSKIVIDRCHVLLVWALVILISTGVFMACGVALKVYYLPVFWYKMLALGAGILFHFYVRRPLLKFDLEKINPMIVKLTALASVLVWFMVAATGRWIGFSG